MTRAVRFALLAAALGGAGWFAFSAFVCLAFR
jgi:hypothetical protein